MIKFYHIGKNAAAPDGPPQKGEIIDMLQKTFEIASRSDAVRVAETLEAIPEAAAAGCALLKVFVFGFSHEETTELLRPIREAFPKLIVTGLTMYMAKPPHAAVDALIFDEKPELRLGFFFFERSSVRRLSYDSVVTSPEDTLRAIRGEIASTPHVKGVCMTLAGFPKYVSSLLERLTAGFEDIPFFGTMADVYSISSERKTEPYVFDGERAYTHGVTVLLFTGEDLHVDAQYIFGWKPVGKAMPILPSERDYPVGDTIVAAIDGVAPEKIYRKYLGIQFDEFLTVNSCEFPLVVERDGLLLGRTPLACTDEGDMVFLGSIRPNESVRFSYTVREDLIANTEKESHEMLAFAPQAIELFECGNRSIMLLGDAVLELECFRRIVPETLHCSAAGEIYYHHGRGELLNSALVAVGFREGEPRDMASCATACELVRPSTAGMRPLSERTLKFMQAMGGDIIHYAQEAQRASKAKSAFLASMSHEIRTPINAILGMDEMILRESSEEQILSYADDIRNAGKTLLSIINDILDFSKIEEGKMEILPVHYGLSSLINDLVNMMRPRIEDKGLHFVVEVDEEIPHLLIGDEIRIRQCALNVLTNAAKYTEKGSVTLRVDCEKLDGDRIALRFSVSDTGIGMKPEDMARLFSPFERIEEKRNRSIEGTGLGMSITKQLLEMMDSRLEVESVYGEGSTFSFAVAQQVVEWAPIGRFAGRYETDASLRSYRELFHAPDARVLVVDDTPVNLTVIRGLLKKTRVQVVTAETGQEALNKAAKEAFDVYLIDHMMPGMDGIETLEELKKLPGQADKPYIALTANAISGAREMYLDAGFTGYLAKPVDGAKLEQMLLACLPPEKVENPDDASQPSPAEPDAPAPVLPGWLREIGEIDADAGLRHCDTAETYLNTLTIFARNASAGADELEGFRLAGDAANATVKVHALKSMLRTIGAEDFGALAEKLELAGKAGDTQTLFEGLEKLLPRFRALGAALAPLCAAGAGEEDSSLPLISDDALREAYDSLRELAVNLDSDNAQYVLDYLKDYRIPDAERQRVDELRRAVTSFDWERVNELLP